MKNVIPWVNTQLYTHTHTHSHTFTTEALFFNSAVLKHCDESQEPLYSNLNNFLLIFQLSLFIFWAHLVRLDFNVIYLERREKSMSLVAIANTRIWNFTMPFDQLCASLSWHKHPPIPCNTSLKVEEQSRNPTGFPLATWQEPTRSASRKRRKLYSRELSAKLFHYTQVFFFTVSLMTAVSC